MTIAQQVYKSVREPRNLTFDEASLFWRLRMGEGIPERKWHKPLDKSKSWHQVKASLDAKIGLSSKVFQATYPKPFSVNSFVKRFLITLKRAFLMTD